MKLKELNKILLIFITFILGINPKVIHAQEHININKELNEFYQSDRVIIEVDSQGNRIVNTEEGIDPGDIVKDQYGKNISFIIKNNNNENKDTSNDVDEYGVMQYPESIDPNKSNVDETPLVNVNDIKDINSNDIEGIDIDLVKKSDQIHQLHQWITPVIRPGERVVLKDIIKNWINLENRNIGKATNLVFGDNTNNNTTALIPGYEHNSLWKLEDDHMAKRINKLNGRKKVAYLYGGSQGRGSTNISDIITERATANCDKEIAELRYYRYDRFVNSIAKTKSYRSQYEGVYIPKTRKERRLLKKRWKNQQFNRGWNEFLEDKHKKCLNQDEHKPTMLNAIKYLVKRFNAAPDLAQHEKILIYVYKGNKTILMSTAENAKHLNDVTFRNN